MVLRFGIVQCKQRAFNKKFVNRIPRNCVCCVLHMELGWVGLDFEGKGFPDCPQGCQLLYSSRFFSSI